MLSATVPQNHRSGRSAVARRQQSLLLRLPYPSPSMCSHRMNADPQQAKDPSAAKRGVAARRNSTTAMTCCELLLRKLNRWSPATLRLNKPVALRLPKDSTNRRPPFSAPVGHTRSLNDWTKHAGEMRLPGLGRAYPSQSQPRGVRQSWTCISYFL